MAELNECFQREAYSLQSFARALYSRNPTMILDDVLTGLDRSTERHVLDAVFGPDGLLKMFNSTVILATNSGETFHRSPAYRC